MHKVISIFLIVIAAVGFVMQCNQGQGEFIRTCLNLSLLIIAMYYVNESFKLTEQKRFHGRNRIYLLLLPVLILLVVYYICLIFGIQGKTLSVFI